MRRFWKWQLLRFVVLCSIKSEPMKKEIFKKNPKNNLQCQCRELEDEARLFKIIRWTWSGFLSFCVKQVPFLGQRLKSSRLFAEIVYVCMTPPTVARCLTS